MDYKFNDSRTPLELFHAGDSVRAYEFMGAHRVNWDKIGRASCRERV